MANNELLMNANEVVAFLQKPSSEFTKEDIVRFIQENDIKMVNFMYPGGDGKLKTLNFIINNLAYLDTILTCGERVDGSSLFSFIQAGSSDLYVLPRFSSAFVDPFAEIPTLCMLASYFDKDGNPLESSPEYTLAKAAKAFREVTGMEFHAMGELEYYVITPDEEVFPAVDQRGYHESMPYAKTNDFRTLCMSYIAKAGGQIKYGHSEVGNFSQDGLIYEQNEIEFLPVPVEKAADELMIAKWIIRNLAYQMGMNVTFAPKITTGKAGSGMHVHMRMMKDGKSMMVENGKLSNTARTAIAGLMQLADSITAFGNKNPMAYFRLVPHQEAPHPQESHHHQAEGEDDDDNYVSCSCMKKPANAPAEEPEEEPVTEISEYNGDTRLKHLLDVYPWLKAELPQINPAFKMLSSPLARIMIPRATISMMSERSGMPIPELIAAIQARIAAHKE